MQQPTIFDLISKYKEIKEKDVQFYLKVQSALNIIIQGLEIYGLNHFVISYNGGKDSDVCAQLWRMAVYLYLESHGNLGDYMESIENSIFLVFHTPDDFLEIDEHLKKVISSINVEAVHSNKNFKEGLKGIIDRYSTQAVVLGVRRTDPQGSNLQPHTHSTPDYPPFMRILPILEWSYGDVWKFIQVFSIPYCVLYQQGFVFFFLYFIIDILLLVQRRILLRMKHYYKKMVLIFMLLV